MDFFGADIQNIIRQTILSIVPFLLAATVHEFMHGYAAYKLGDPTAYRAGRLTLNPLAHIDPIGLLCLLLTRMFGWAKPVPVNFYLLKHKYGMAIVSFAGPLANLILAVLSVAALHAFGYAASVVTIPESVAYPIMMMIFYSIRINVALFVFNLLPILPLDGGRILHNFLPRNLAARYETTERYGFVIIIVLIVTGAVNYVLLPPIRFINSIIM